MIAIFGPVLTVKPALKRFHTAWAKSCHSTVSTNLGAIHIGPRFVLGFVRKVPTHRSCCVANRLVRESDRNAHLQPAKSSATPAVPRLSSPCLIAARRLFVQTLDPC